MNAKDSVLHKTRLALAALLLLLPSSLGRKGGPYGSCVSGVDCKPPMGWRSWNAYHARGINQTLLTAVLVAMAKTGDGTPDDFRGEGNSFLSLGFSDVGIDDDWQACGKGVNASFHDIHGVPIVDTKKFPDMKAMTDYGKSLGLKMGWYANNCICHESNTDFKPTNSTKPTLDDIYEQDAKATVITYGYRSTKLDGCGQFRDLDRYYDKFEKYTELAGEPGLLIEACHGGRSDLPTLDWCPYSYFRSSMDIQAKWENVWNNLQSVVKFAIPQDQKGRTLSRPGCWAYPDMLEVGMLTGGFVEDRSHFGAWCICSSPLILGHDVTDEERNKRVWPVVSNEEAIAVNQKWYGHPGTVVYNATNSIGWWKPHTVIDYQIWMKPQGPTSMAIFFISNKAIGTEAIVPLALALKGGREFSVRSIWDKKDLGNYTHFQPGVLEGHDSHFFLVTVESTDVTSPIFDQDDSGSVFGEFVFSTPTRTEVPIRPLSQFTHTLR